MAQYTVGFCPLWKAFRHPHVTSKTINSSRSSNMDFLQSLCKFRPRCSVRHRSSFGRTHPRLPRQPYLSTSCFHKSNRRLRLLRANRDSPCLSLSLMTPKGLSVTWCEKKQHSN